MKNKFLDKYKLINIILFGLMSFTFIWIEINQTKWFANADIDYIYKFFDGIYHPLLIGAKWLAGILAVLLFFPSRIFKKWLIFVLPLPLIATFLLIANISVYSSGVLYISRAQMAENGMIVLAVLTALFIAGHLFFDWKKKR